MIDIVCATDDKYCEHASAMLHSLRHHNHRQTLNVYLLAPPDLNKKKREKLATFCDELKIKLTIIEVPDDLVEQLPSKGYLSKVVWYRAFMPQLLPNLEKILFLDCDVIINGPIDALWSIDLENFLFAAVTNVADEHHSRRVCELGLNSPRNYFNAGIALWNLKEMRKCSFTKTVIDFSQLNQNKLLWLEQDAINALYSDRVRLIHPKWNYQNGICFNIWGTRFLDPTELSEAQRHPLIIHFEGGGSGKPWHFQCKHPLRQLYFDHRAQTPWPKVKKEGKTLKNIIKRVFPARD